MKDGQGLGVSVNVCCTPNLYGNQHGGQPEEVSLQKVRLEQFQVSLQESIVDSRPFPTRKFRQGTSRDRRPVFGGEKRLPACNGHGLGLDGSFKKQMITLNGLLELLGQVLCSWMAGCMA